MFTKIYEHLKREGFDVYSIGQHKGPCETPYVVIKENSRFNSSYSLSSDIVDIIIFYPQGCYSETRLFMQSVITALKALKWLRSTGEITPTIIDDSVRAYTCSLKYQIFRRRDE